MSERPAGSVRQLVRDSLAILRRNPYLLLWFAFLVLFPFYLYPSGTPQIADYLMAVLVPLVFAGLQAKLHPRTLPVARALILFVCYVTIINVAWSVALDRYTLSGAHGFLLHPLFYIYNACVFLIALMFYSRFGDRFVAVTLFGVIVSVGVQCVGSLFHQGGGGAGQRPTLFFNNPNQLGYYGLLIASIAVFASRKVRVSVILQTLAFGGGLYLALLSSSKAAIFSVGILAVFSFAQRPRTIVVAGAVLWALVTFYGPAQEAYERTAMRVDGDDDTASGALEGRGYDRITNHVEYWLFGAGEGGYDRFESAIGDHELHSSLGTLFFSYGLIGTFLFAAFALRVVQGGGLRTTLLLIPAGLYGLTHQGLRFTLLWVLLAIVVCTKLNAARAGPPRQRR